MLQTVNSSETRATAATAPRWAVRSAAVVVLVAALVAANGLGGYIVPGSLANGMTSWPQPIGSIVRLLAIQSWPMYEPADIRWLAWAVGATALVVLIAASGQWRVVSGKGRGVTGDRLRDAGTRGSGEEEVEHGPMRRTLAPEIGTYRILFLLSVGLVALVAVRAAFAAVPAVGWTWTWQLGLGLLWMLTMYVWTPGTGVRTLGLSLPGAVAILCAVSLLSCAQLDRPYPVWPVGNVLVLTSECLMALFILAAWGYGSWRAVRQVGGALHWISLIVAAALLVPVGVALWMSGRRAAVLGLLAGAGFIAVATLGASVRWRTWRVAGVLAGVMIAASALYAVVVPRMLTTGRWETVLLRREMYKGAGSILLSRPATLLVGVGPGHLGFELTSLLRPLHAASPRLFHGAIAEHVHSEPLEAIAELGMPVGLLYLALPLGGLIGFGLSYRGKTAKGSAAGGEASPDNLMMLGLGAALAAVMAAEATSVGMRQPGVAMFVWALTGIGWACGAKAGWFGWLGRTAGFGEDASGMRRAAFLEVVSAPSGVAAVVVSVGVLLASWQSIRASGYLYQAQEAAEGERFAEAAAILDGHAFVPTGNAWMMWKYLQGRVNARMVDLYSGDTTQADRWRATAIHSLETLYRACPGYEDTAIWLAKMNPARGKELREQMLRYDPYDGQTRMMQAEDPEAPATRRAQALRLAIRNECITQETVAAIVKVAKDAAVGEELMRIVTLAQTETDRESGLGTRPSSVGQQGPGVADPLALESLRLGIVLAGQAEDFEEALRLSDEAAALCSKLSTDPWRDRLETVHIEVYLDQAWFGWLVDPSTAAARLATLEVRFKDLVRGPAQSFSEAMAGQFLAMLYLSQEQPKTAAWALYMSDPVIQRQAVKEQGARAYARLVALAGTRVPPAQVQAWATHGANLMGKDAWQQALATFVSRGPIPWWQGVLGQ